MPKPYLSLILGSGFSSLAGLPTTEKLSTKFLITPEDGTLTIELEEFITQVLVKFWSDVFHYHGDQAVPPSLENHFTIIDLAANSGHHIGKEYNPKKLRAIRRMSIHRIFQILDVRYPLSDVIQRLLTSLVDNFQMSIISLNWDIVLEQHLSEIDEDYHYKDEVEYFDRGRSSRKGIPILKVHGSSNWLYCDSCRRLFSSNTGKGALHYHAYLEPDDFLLFDPSIDTSALDSPRSCKYCANKLGGRIATFSYRKAFSITQFQSIWERAHTGLSRANNWLFIGYSLPEADFEFKHLLKSAQFSRRDPDKWSATIILKDDLDAAERYMRLFGLHNEHIIQSGLGPWVEGVSMRNYIDRMTP